MEHTRIVQKDDTKSMYIIHKEDALITTELYKLNELNELSLDRTFDKYYKANTILAIDLKYPDEDCYCIVVNKINGDSYINVVRVGEPRVKVFYIIDKYDTNIKFVQFNRNGDRVFTGMLSHLLESDNLHIYYSTLAHLNESIIKIEESYDLLRVPYTRFLFDINNMDDIVNIINGLTTTAYKKLLKILGVTTKEEAINILGAEHFTLELQDDCECGSSCSVKHSKNKTDINSICK